MTPLEQRYRKLLRRLPSSYRRRWEDDMVVTYLDTTVPDDPEEAEYVEQCGRPSREERLSILRLAVRLRLGGTGDPPHAQAWGDAVRRVALMGLLANTVLPLSGLWRGVWFSGRLGWPPLPPEVAEMAAVPQPVWQTLLSAATLLWVVAFVATVLGRRREAVVAGAIAAIPTAASVARAVELAVTAGVVLGFLVTTLALAIVTVLPLLALAAFHAQSQPVARRPWLVALAGTAVLAAVPAYLSLVPIRVLVDRPGLWSLALAGAAGVHLARRRVDLGRTLALAIVAGVVLTLRVVTLLDLVAADLAGLDGAMPTAIVQTLVVAVLGGVLWARAARGLRDLPITDDQASPPIVTG